jgi:predicted Zn-dependent protease
MKKFFITLVTGILMVTTIRAQSIQDGVSDLYAERFKSAKSSFEKLVAANPNNIEAVYWLGQTYIAMNDIPGARDVYSKALMASANAPLLIVGMGHVELLENKQSESRQRFEAAITMTRGKKGDDPVILNAIGRAIVNTYNEKEKKGDINYAVEKLEAAAARDDKSAEIYTNLGNAYRKAKPGEGGGRAFESYKKANAANPNFAPAYHRLAHLFNSQRNWDLYEQYLNDAVSKDPKFAPAYYDLYYLKLGKLDFPAAQDMASKYIANSDPDPQAEHFKAQTSWAEKKYDEAIAISKGIIAKAGDQTKPRTYILLADSYLAKGDTVAARPYIDEYFAKAKPEDISAVHYGIKAKIYSGIPGQEDVVFNSYLDGVKADTVLDNKIDLLKAGAAFFKGKKQYDKESQLQQMLIDIKPNPTLTDLFNATLSYYFAGKYGNSRDLALKMVEKYPAEPYGYEWKLNNALAIDTVKKDSIAVPDALSLIEFAQKDSVKYKKQLMKAAGYLVNYYANDAKDVAKALEYVNRMIALDPTNTSLQPIKDQLEKAKNKPNNPRSSPQPKQGGSGSGSIKKKESNTV